MAPFRNPDRHLIRLETGLRLSVMHSHKGLIPEAPVSRCVASG